MVPTARTIHSCAFLICHTKRASSYYFKIVSNRVWHEPCGRPLWLDTKKPRQPKPTGLVVLIVELPSVVCVGVSCRGRGGRGW
jgi:hypothetical protein